VREEDGGGLVSGAPVPDLALPAPVFIGMPTYNNAPTIERAIRSWQAQTHPDFSLLISDDRSSDATVGIARDFAATDRRIRVVVQERNLNYGNFRFVLNAARAPFFVFAAGDDWWEPRFLEGCLDALREEPGAVCAAPRVLRHPLQGDPFLSAATEPLVDSVERNLVRYLISPKDNSRMYGVYRTEAARRAFPSRDYFAFDWAFCAATLVSGTYVQVDEVLMHREVTPSSRYVEYVRRDNGWWLTRLFPLLPLTWDLLLRPGVPITRGVLRALLIRNWNGHASYVQRFHPLLRTLYRIPPPAAPAPLSGSTPLE